jgi:hypothetical protein
MAVKKPAAKQVVAPVSDCLNEPRTHCPITKDLIKIVEVGEFWMGATSLWTTRPYRSKARLLYELSYNNGKAPNFPDPDITVTRYENEPPTKYPVGVDE